MTSRIKSKITLVTSIIVIMMMFVVPFFLPNSIANNITFNWIYFTSFFVLMGWTNYTNDKISNMSVEEKREDKLKDLLNER